MTTRAQYDIPLVLPGLPDVADACVERLVALLKPRAGVTKVHVLPAVDAAPPPSLQPWPCARTLCDGPGEAGHRSAGGPRAANSISTKA